MTHKTFLSPKHFRALVAVIAVVGTLAAIIGGIVFLATAMTPQEANYVDTCVIDSVNVPKRGGVNYIETSCGTFTIDDSAPCSTRTWRSFLAKSTS